MNDQLAEISRFLYSPVTVALYFAAAFTYLVALTTTVGRRESSVRGRRAQQVGAVLAVAGVGGHVAHEIVRGLAQSRFPLGNMFEVTSLMALVGVAGGVGYLQFVRRRGELNGFVLLAGGLLMAFAGLMYAEPGPLMPILDTWWRHFHVSLLVGAMGVFAAGFVFNTLYLLRERADRRLEAHHRVPVASGGGVDLGASEARAVGGLEDHEDDLPDAPGSMATADRSTFGLQRRGTSVLWLTVGTFVGTGLVSWVFIVSASDVTWGVARFLGINLAMVAAALVARWFVPFLPSADTLDGLAHRTIVFAFVIWTVGTIAGAMWAEQSWGRFWGWDPKETGAFLTWIAYAGYLHARATRGVRGRRAAWIGVGAFFTLMATYLIANYVIVGFHSYAGI
ncbi:MAG: cytochrome c biogenesis protein CcsA [Nitriliruptoraceae bacterium]